MITALVLAVLLTPTPAPYQPVPCPKLIARAGIAGASASLDAFAVLFEEALDEHWRWHPQNGLRSDDVYKAESDFNACVIGVPATPQPKASPTHR